MKDPMFDNLAERFAGHELDVDPGTWNAISGKLAVANGSSLSEMLQEKFAGHEAPVDPHIWTNISSQLGHGAAAGVGTTTGWWAAGIAATLVAGSFLVYTLVSEPTPTAVAENVPVASPVLPEVQPVAAEPTTQNPSIPAAPLTNEADLSSDRSGPTKNSVPSTKASEHPEKEREARSKKGVPLVPPPSPEGEKTVNAVLQDIVDNFVTSPAVVATEKIVPLPTQPEMPSRSVHVDHQDVVVNEPEQEEPELPQAVPAPTLAVLIPTAFSPNGDGVNDELEVNVQNYQKALVRIFSASSNALVFAADNLDAKWNGRMMNSGQPCEPGMYFYALEVTDAEGRAWSKGEVVRLFQR